MGLAHTFAKCIETEFFLKCGFVQATSKRPKKQSNPRTANPNKKQIGHLLESLDRSFFIMKHARPYIAHNPAFAFGAHVMWDDTDDDEGYALDRLEFADYHGLPSGFMIILEPKDRRKTQVPMVLIAEKMPRYNKGVEYSADTVYRFGRVFVITDKADGTPLKRPEVIYDNYHVAVSRAGEVRALKHRQPCVKRVSNSKHIRTFYDKSRWNYRDFATESEDSCPGKEGIEHAFTLAYNLYSRRATGCEVYAEKNNTRLVFNIPDSDFKTFFAKRIPVVQDGVKKRILHWVSAHERIRNSNVSYIRSHLRGLTDFTWNEAHIKIRLDGFNSSNSSSFDLTPLPDNKAHLGVQVAGDTLFNKIAG